MKFMSMVYSSEKNGPPPAALMQAIAQLGMEANKAGTMVQMGGLYGSAQGARVRLRAGKITVVDGPFTESKEIIGGFAVFQFGTKKEAIEQVTKFMELHRQHWPGWEGESEVRQIFE